MQGLVSDVSLKVLADDEWSVLDLARCSHLSDGAILEALSRTPLLRALDITGCSVSTATLRQLPRHCPLLQVLRLGMSHTFAPNEAPMPPWSTAVISGCSSGSP